MKKITEKLDLIAECKNNFDVKSYSLIPVLYQITMTPTLPIFDFNLSNDVDVDSVDTSSQSIEIKIDMNIKLYCNRSVNKLKLRTREFSGIFLE
jgi:hypothetical protein